jgi:CheY-like chemotaxis protein
VQEVAARSQPKAEIVRASTVAEAEKWIATEDWDIILLDVSMDIRSSQAAMAHTGGHANLGGLAIAQKMFLKRREFPTIILTAFDSFQAEGSRRERAEIVGLEDIERRARDLLGEAFLGCVRYGAAHWDDILMSMLSQRTGQ